METITQWRPPGGKRIGNNRGFALLVVIMVLLLASFLASQLTLDVRTEQRLAANARERSRGAILAEAGFNIALFRLMDKPVALEAEDEYGRLVAGRQYTHSLKGGQVRYHAANESGKIDLNAVDSRLLELFLRHRKLTMEQAGVVLDSLLDWRDPDNLQRLNGAEQEFYMNLPEPYIPRNGRIEDPSEFFLLRGADLLAGKFSAAEVFTVHNRENAINVNSLTPAMLDFVVEGDESRRLVYHEARQLHDTLNAAMIRQIIGEKRFSELEPFLRYEDGASSLFFTITATGEAGEPDEPEKSSGPGMTVNALVRIHSEGYQLLSWQERYS
ncbi:MAG: general secretion pathway protein GspK [Proteobacteria bacterium]|nr:general secretion pathway protein GspK [Pseudomonadota bacterium]MBU2459480.1 general secretion pathway protein GspK [Nanoarchaeota archaeon]